MQTSGEQTWQTFSQTATRVCMASRLILPKLYEEDDEGHTVVPSYFAQFSAASFEKKGLKP